MLGFQGGERQRGSCSSTPRSVPAVGLVAPVATVGAPLTRGCSVISATLLNAWPLSWVLWRLCEYARKYPFMQSLCVLMCLCACMRVFNIACWGLEGEGGWPGECFGERIYTSSLMKQVPALLQRPRLGPYVIFGTITNGALRSYHDLKLMVRSSLAKPHLWEIRIFWHPGNLTLALGRAPSYVPVLDLTTWLAGRQFFPGTLPVCLDLSIPAQGRSC